MGKTHYYIVDPSGITKGTAVSTLDFKVMPGTPFPVEGLEVSQQPYGYDRPKEASVKTHSLLSDSLEYRRCFLMERLTERTPPCRLARIFPEMRKKSGFPPFYVLSGTLSLIRRSFLSQSGMERVTSRLASVSATSAI
jgi:hypothetical protein